MFPALAPRPLPPSRANSRKKTGGGKLNSSGITPTNPLLSNKLSSSSLNSSMPPDSPVSPENYMSSITNLQPPSSPIQSKTRATGKSMLNSDFISTESPLHFPSVPSPATQIKEHVVSTQAVRMYESDGEEDESLNFDEPWLKGQTRDNLEELLVTAHRLIRVKERDLRKAGGHGMSLLAENKALKSRQEALANSTPRSNNLSASRAQRPSPRAWKDSIGSPLPQSLSPTKTRRSIDSISWDGSIHRKSSSSNGSLFTAEIGSRNELNSSMREEVQELHNDNYDLTMQLSELKVEADRLARQGEKKKRQLEKEIETLKQEYERVETRNSELERGMIVTNDYEDGSWGRAGSMSSTSSHYRLSLESEILPGLDGEEEENVDEEVDRTMQPTSTNPTSVDTPTHTGYRAAGVGFTGGRLSNELFMEPDSAEPTAAENLDGIFEELLAKIDELEGVNKILVEEKRLSIETIELAEQEISDFRRKFEAMEEELAEKRIEWRQPAQIGWNPTASTSSARPRGNQRMIQAYRKRVSPKKPIVSHSSKNSLSSLDEYENSWTLADPPRFLRNGSRSLAEEMESEIEGEFSSTSTSVPNPRSGKSRNRGPGGIRNLVYTSTRFDTDRYDSSRENKNQESEDGSEMLDSLRSLKFDEPREETSFETRFTLDSVNGKKLDAVKNRRYKEGLAANDRTATSRRTLALHRIGLPSTSMTTTTCPDNNGSRCSQEDEVEVDSNDSYEYLKSRDYAGRERTDYYPDGLIARYHPRMVVTRLQSAASRQVMLTLLYVRFFLMLGLAIVWALWQGPKKTLGLIDNSKPNRKRI